MTLNRGDFVILQTIGSVAVVRRAWEDLGYAVTVCDEDQYLEKMAGAEFELLPYPREFVYVFEEGATEKINHDQVGWTSLMRLPSKKEIYA